MATLGIDEHRQMLSQLCRICGERLMKSKDRYENSFPCANREELIFSAFGIKVHEDDPETCPSKFCHKCYKLASRGGTRIAINVCPAHKRTGNCAICISFKEQQKPGRREKSKPGMKPSKEAEIQDGMSGTLSFQPDENGNLFCQQVKDLKTYRGTEPLNPELFAENIKFEYICPICKEVLDQPVQTKCPTPHIFCACCLSFSITTCGPQCPLCRTAMGDPKTFVEPAPFVLQTIISELDFKCPTCRQIIKLGMLPQHQEQDCNPTTITPPMPTYKVTLHGPELNTAAVVQNPVPAEVPPPAPDPGNAAAQAPTQAQLPAPVANPLPAPGPTYGQLTIQQLLHSPKEAFSSVKEEVGLYIIRQFLAKSQDGTTILLRTGGQVKQVLPIMARKLLFVFIILC